MIPVTIGAGTSQTLSGVYSFRNVTAPAGATAQVDDGRTFDLGGSFRSFRAPASFVGGWRSVKFTAPSGAALAVEVTYERGEPLEGAGSPPLTTSQSDPLWTQPLGENGSPFAQDGTTNALLMERYPSTLSGPTTIASWDVTAFLAAGDVEASSLLIFGPGSALQEQASGDISADLVHDLRAYGEVIFYFYASSLTLTGTPTLNARNKPPEQWQWNGEATPNGGQELTTGALTGASDVYHSFHFGAPVNAAGNSRIERPNHVAFWINVPGASSITAGTCRAWLVGYPR